MKGQIFSADLLTKDDWSINPAVFRVIDAKWGPHTIDRFASHYNAQVPRFNSKFASPGCSGVDALSQDWRNENNWVCPPVYGRVFRRFLLWSRDIPNMGVVRNI